MSGLDDCGKLLLTQADFDGELDAAAAAALAIHQAGCPACQAALADLDHVRAEMRDDALYHRAPDSLRRAVAARGSAHASMAPRPAGWRRRRGASFGLGAVAATAAILLVALWPQSPGLIDQIVDDHIRALQPGHLQDVASADPHTVKPWFDGRIDFAPPVKDLVDQGFPLTGGRLDYLDGRAVAGLVYEHNRHVINMFVWPAAGTSAASVGGATTTTAERDGYNVIHWVDGGMALWVVSDLEKSELAEFVRLWRAAP